MTNQGCKVRPEIVNVNSDESAFYPFTNKTSKCSGSCHNTIDPDAKMLLNKDYGISIMNNSNFIDKKGVW